MSLRKAPRLACTARPPQLALSRWENEGGAIVKQAKAVAVRQRTDETGAREDALSLTLKRSKANA